MNASGSLGFVGGLPIKGRAYCEATHTKPRVVLWALVTVICDLGAYSLPGIICPVAIYGPWQKGAKAMVSS